MPTDPTKPKRKPKTVKEIHFAKEYIENGGNGVQAALAAYDTENYASANVIAQENLQKLSFDHYFEKAGLTDEAIAGNISRIANEAMRIHGGGDDFIEINDEPTRLKANELAVRIMGKFAPPRAPVDEDGNTVLPIYAIEAE